MRLFLASMALFIGVMTTAMAETPILSAPEAETQMSDGSLVLLDIRSEQEWRDTGLAAGAWPVSMHDRDFGAHLRQILEHVPAENIALICATGGRTAHVTQILERNGITGVADVSEGMMGSPRGPGWIARGMSVVSLDEAAKSFEAAKADW